MNKQYDANGPVDRRETSSLLMSTCPITRRFNWDSNLTSYPIPFRSYRSLIFNFGHCVF